ncbi:MULTISPECIES: recombinase family protein [unclassified Paenibacillus]|uniref:recombinase family protein n=1 Tax=unclassified Paenibacillus TaxID=185978 RepID=UPI002405E093|nr:MULTISPECIES: recombinase family protein [unclassified Paenibacillus]MDF9841865.1 site-specific DNA recombinase [Paenibacillus sp. PastF-2]MDF9848454.1 site-specific DNA recombinase [Paenibacillus sp. PastM-2]MDF9855025.1 site-specific DNA recombinase [Paenibacillus sp. PastF-1]MDH6480294.1 site-specific DNA recombinase [Paenibacillus sp. PastH-2]MDH6507722.1 site-specific DNA recombinase [Paenibacillus sp. PastM-3]
MDVALYLRKSRADEDAERRGEGETLAKHKTALLKLAKQLKLNIIRIREEIVSGETLVHRPEMLQLLKEVESGEYDAVLVMDIDRFGRGNMQEQGLILETFRSAKTKIITPRKTYDLMDEFDEEYSEFEAFMARKELKIITRRMQGGRKRSAEEGNFIGTRPPFGYLIENLPDGRGRTLTPHPEQAEIVKQIFAWYTHEDPEQQKGGNKIASELERLKIPSYKGGSWSASSVLTILRNEVYIGRIQWGKKELKKSKDGSKHRTSRHRSREEWVDVLGKHIPIIDKETFMKANRRLSEHHHSPHQFNVDGKPRMTSALAGLVKCSECGLTMVYRPYGKRPAHFRCNTVGCPTRSSRYDAIEARIVEGLEIWLNDYKIKWGKRNQTTPQSELKLKERALASLQNELKELENQRGKLFDFLERGIYTEEVFMERSQEISKRIAATNEGITRVQKDLDLELTRKEAKSKIIPIAESVVKSYYQTDNPMNRNALLKSVLNKVVYKKGPTQSKEQFELFLHPRL